MYKCNFSEFYRILYLKSEHHPIFMNSFKEVLKEFFWNIFFWNIEEFNF